MNMTIVLDGQTVWNFKFQRELTVAESDEFNILLQIIGSPPEPQNASQDLCRWRIAPSDPFTVRKCYESHCRTLSLPSASEFPYKFIWKSKAPARIKFFTWLACLNKCLTVDNLNKRGRFIVSRCPLCKASLETLPHILLHCPFSISVWNAFLLIPGGVWTMPANPIDLALGWKAIGHWSRRGKLLWSVLPIAVWWGLWLERNARTFQRKESSILQVINHVRSLIYSWLMIIPECNGLTLSEITLNWSSCVQSL